MRHIGVSNFSVGKLERIQQIAPVETLQPEYSLIERDAETKLLPFAEREGIGVIVYSPMGSGMLTGAMTRERVRVSPRRTGAAATSASTSRSCPRTSPWSSACSVWPSATTSPQARLRSPGR